MGKKVFISHSSKDSKIATAICTALEARGHDMLDVLARHQAGREFPGHHRARHPRSRRDGAGVLRQRQQFRRDQEGNGAGQPVAQDGDPGPRRRRDAVRGFHLRTGDPPVDRHVHRLGKVDRGLVRPGGRGEPARRYRGAAGGQRWNRPSPPARATRRSFAVLAVLLLAGGAAAYWSSHRSAPAPAAVLRRPWRRRSRTAAPAPPSRRPDRAWMPNWKASCGIR